MQHRINFEALNWEDTINKINKQIDNGYLLYKIETENSNLYYNGYDSPYISQKFEVEMFKMEEENE